MRSGALGKGRNAGARGPPSLLPSRNLSRKPISGQMHGEEAGCSPAGGEAGIRRGVAGALMFTFVIAVIAVGPSAVRVRPSLAHAASYILERSGRRSRDRRGIVQIQILSCLLLRQQKRKRRPGVFLAFGWATISRRARVLGVFCWSKRAAAFPRISLFPS